MVRAMYRPHGGGDPPAPPRRQGRRGPHVPRFGFAGRAVLAWVVALAACAQTENDRPATLQYLTEAILQPSCGQYTCHSSFRRAKGYAFDTVDAARTSLTLPGVVNTTDPTSSLLYLVLTRRVKRMPYDAPLAQKDIDLIFKWIDDGAPGLDLP